MEKSFEHLDRNNFKELVKSNVELKKVESRINDILKNRETTQDILQGHKHQSNMQIAGMKMTDIKRDEMKASSTQISNAVEQNKGKYRL